MFSASLRTNFYPEEVFSPTVDNIYSTDILDLVSS